MKKLCLFLILLLSFTFTALSQVQIYSNSFESIGDFYTDSTNSIWEQGTPQKSVIDTAYSGQGVWITDLDSAYQGIQNSYLYSPQIVIAPFDSGYISFWQFVDLDTSLLSGKDICSISYRKGADTNWLSLGYQGFVGASNWFNANSAGSMGWHYDSSGWFNSSFPFYRNHSGSYFYQVDTVQFRFTFHSYANHSAAGWAIDDFGIFGWNMPVDLGIMDIVLPNDSTITGDQTPVRLKLKNFGLSTINTLQCSVLLDNSSSLTQTFTFSNGLLPDSIVEVNFSNTYIAPNKDYTLTAIAKINNDNVVQNDTLRKMIVSKPAQYDIAVIEMEVNPSHHDTTCIYHNIHVILKLKNCGYDTIKATDLSYKINNNLNSSEIWNGVLAPGDTVSYQFSKTYRGVLGVYSLCTYATVVGENFLENNSFCSNYLGSWWCIYAFEELNTANLLLTISPNPAINTINIILPNGVESKQSSLSIYDVSGKEMKQITISKTTKSITINISTLPPSIYYIHLKSDNQVLGSGKFIKQ